MKHSPQWTSEQRDNLVAYLDGELDETAAQDIERTLAQDEVAQREVDLYIRTWQLLDALPQTSTSDGFTERTLSSILVEDVAPHDPKQTDWQARARRGLRLAGWTLGLLCAAYLGFFATHQAIPNRPQELIDELPVIESLDVYTEIDSLEFLRELQQSHLFDHEPDEE